MTLKLVSADAGQLRFLLTDSYQPDSIRGLIAEGARRMAAAEGEDAATVERKTRKLLDTIKMARDEHTEIDVGDGMTRRINSDKETTSIGLGAVLVKREVKTVTVTPLP